MLMRHDKFTSLTEYCYFIRKKRKERRLSFLEQMNLDEEARGYLIKTSKYEQPQDF